MVRYRRRSKQLCARFVDMCCRAIKRLQAKNPLENDISIPFFTMMANNSAGFLEIEENLGKTDSILRFNDMSNRIDHKNKKPPAL